MRAFLSLMVFLALVSASFVVAVRWEEYRFLKPGPSAIQTDLVIEPGSSLRTIAAQLRGAGAIENETLFRISVMRRGKAADLKAGEYGLPPQASQAQIMDMLVEHKVSAHRITIAEGLTSDAIIALVKAHPVPKGIASKVPEGSLLPETYLFERGITRAELLERMHQAQLELLTELWPNRNMDLPFATPQEALTLASIVEKETGLAEERPRIAAVFINRLKDGMRLESDPTIIYGLTNGAPLGHPLRRSELRKPNPYSTYQISGLPPTPICNPGRDAIAAVLNPAASEDLFFVADGTGGHAFARTLAEHGRNVAQLRRLERRR